MRGKAKLKSLFKLSCHLTGAPENKWVKDENKQVCWKRASIATNEPQNQQEFVTLMNENGLRASVKSVVNRTVK